MPFFTKNTRCIINKSSVWGGGGGGGGGCNTSVLYTLLTVMNKMGNGVHDILFSSITGDN